MSLIHCSPLFIPLEPLPLMGPAAMRSEHKPYFPQTSKPTKTKGGASTMKKGKTAVLSRQTTHSPAQTASASPALVASPYMQRHSTAEPTASSHSGPASFQGLEAPTAHDSYQQSFFDSQDQGSITFTSESQPMYDLSSSQQRNDQNQ